ncbi:FAD:protein FMN transferase [Stella sp.]|uniref:FAD:protein FMN transferase n=1 Tax=Stella sp. TaxID=2912054 RepID=UPI0035B14862
MLVPPLDAVRPRPDGERVLALAGRSMGTKWQVRVSAPAATGPGRIRQRVEAVLARVVAEASGWEPTSALSAFNRAPAGMLVALPAGLYGVLEHALALARATDGACDPTLAPVIDLWGFGPPGPRRTPPSEDEVAAARARTGWRRLLLDRERGAALQPGGLGLDLCGIAKGWAVDLVSAELSAAGIGAHLVEIGGELRGEGVKPDGQPWWVALERAPGEAGPETLVALHGLAIATSGSYRRCFEAGGRRFAHTIDPRTGQPLADPPLAVTVLHRNCMAADALATALTVLGPEAGLEHARRHGLAARFLIAAGERTSPAFDALLD